MFKKISNKLLYLPVAKKILVILLSSILLSSCMLCAGYTIITLSNNDLLYQTSSKFLSYTSRDITRNLNAVEELGNHILEDTVIQSALTSCKNAKKNVFSQSAYSSIYSSLNDYYQKYKENYVDYIKIINDDFSASASNPKASSLPSDVEKKLRYLANIQDGRLFWVTDYNDTHGIFLIRELRQIENLSLDTLGILIININLKKMQNDISNMNTISPVSYALYSHNKTLYLPENLSGLPQNELPELSTRSYSVKRIQDQRYLITKGRIETTGWDYYCLAPYDELYQNMLLIQKLFLLIILISILLSIVMVKILMKPLISDFDLLVHKIQLFGNDQMETLEDSSSYTDRHDEI